MNVKTHVKKKKELHNILYFFPDFGIDNKCNVTQTPFLKTKNVKHFLKKHDFKLCSELFETHKQLQAFGVFLYVLIKKCIYCRGK